LKLKCDKLLSNVAFNCNLRHYTEEEHGVVELSSGGRFVVVCDPLDGSRNIECNVPTGTIFGVYRCADDPNMSAQVGRCRLTLL